MIRRPTRSRRRRRRGIGGAGSTGAPTREPARSAAARGPLALLAHQVRFDVLASMRNPRARFFTFFFPILLLVIFAGVFGNGTTVVDGVRVELDRFYVPGILAMSIVGAAYGGLVMSVTSARESGVLKRRRATPVAPGLLVAGQALSTLTTAAITSTLLLVVAKLGYGVGIPAAGLTAIAGTVIVGSLAFAALGYAVSGLVGSADAAQPIAQLTTMPLYFISGVWIPNDNLPHALRTIASIFPIEHLAAAAHRASVHASWAAAVSPRDLGVLAVWAVAGCALAAHRFSWLPSTATA
ncbi:MAG: ABC transporter permease [Solirubrobacteraceae bacterium]